MKKNNKNSGVNKNAVVMLYPDFILLPKKLHIQRVETSTSFAKRMEASSARRFQQDQHRIYPHQTNMVECVPP